MCVCVSLVYQPASSGGGSVCVEIFMYQRHKTIQSKTVYVEGAEVYYAFTKLHQLDGVKFNEIRQLRFHRFCFAEQKALPTAKRDSIAS